jgi:CRISPR-associated protein Cas2
LKTAYLVAYDIVDDRRRTKLYKLLRGYGEHLQFSVFRCDLTPVRHAKLLGEIQLRISTREDQVLVVDLGPSVGRGDDCIHAIGMKYISPERTVIVV